MTDELRDQLTDVMLHRVYSEFLEMPGLQLTAKQAQRLWSIDEQTCCRLLNFLVETHFLCLTAQGGYARAAEGRVPCPHLPTAKAAMNDPMRRQITERDEEE